MEVLLALLVGFLFSVGVYMLLSRRLLRIVLGTAILSHATLLLLITTGKLKRGSAPILTDGVTSYVDPLPQALILTAIVIGFAITAFSLVLAYKLYQGSKTDDMEKLTGVEGKEVVAKHE